MFKLLEDAIALMGGGKRDAQNVVDHHYVSTGWKNTSVKSAEECPSASMEGEKPIAGAAEAPPSASTTSENTYVNCATAHQFVSMGGTNTHANCAMVRLYANMGDED
jgi:hypothetical protein